MLEVQGKAFDLKALFHRIERLLVGGNEGFRLLSGNFFFTFLIPCFLQLSSAVLDRVDVEVFVASVEFLQQLGRAFYQEEDDFPQVLWALVAVFRPFYDQSLNKTLDTVLSF